MASDIALRASGRFIVSVSTPSVRSAKRSSVPVSTLFDISLSSDFFALDKFGYFLRHFIYAYKAMAPANAHNGIALNASSLSLGLSFCPVLCDLFFS
jgi:hypothetical protein